MSKKNKRIFRNRLKNRKAGINNLPLTIFVISLILFGGTQLVINSVLSPLGTRLQAFNTEKEYLIEENRGLEEELASSNSLTVIEHITEKTYSLDESAPKQIVYVTDHSVRAER